VSVDYVGFDIPDRWVVGYGLDYDNRFRTLPYIGVLEPPGLFACLSDHRVGALDDLAGHVLDPLGDFRRRPFQSLLVGVQQPERLFIVASKAGGCRIVCSAR